MPNVEKPSDSSGQALGYWLQRFFSVNTWMNELFDNATNFPSWMLSLSDAVKVLPIKELEKSDANSDEAQTRALLARCVDADRALIAWRAKAFGGGPPPGPAKELDIILANRLAMTITKDATGWITYHRHKIEPPPADHPAFDGPKDSPAQVQERQRQQMLQARLQLVEAEFVKANNSRFADLPVRVIALRSVLADHGIAEETPLQVILALKQLSFVSKY